MKRLIEYKYTVSSQWGEDGIIEEIFNRIGEGTKKSAEFGAYDGRYCSNTWNLWANKGWKALLIEGDASRAQNLASRVSDKKNVTAVHAYVAPRGANTFESILKRAWNSLELDLLSIDIDGDDYYIFESLQECRPRVVVIEFNPTIPLNLDIVQEQGQYFGASARALFKLATAKGYTLAEICGANCFFVRDDEYQKISDQKPRIEDLFNGEFLTHVISSYAGYSFLSRIPAFTSGGRNIVRPRFAIGPQLIPVGTIANNGASALKHYILKPLRRARRLWIRMHSRNKPATHEYKVKTILDYARAFGLHELIETGTYMGDTINKVKDHFDSITSIELSTSLHEAAKLKFARFPHIHLIQGDSGKKLADVVEKIQKPALFWLDGHYSGGTTSKSDINTPIIAELSSILKSPFAHVILIDDARCFNGTEDYPTIDQLRKRLEGTPYTLQVTRDIIRIFQP